MDKRKVVFWCVMGPLSFFVGLYLAALLEKMQ